MDDSEDAWPMPYYNPGKPKLLHALGVIAISYTSFQAGMDDLYRFHMRRKNLPEKLIDTFYYSLSEDRRLSALRELFQECEPDPAVKKVVENLIQYFAWCKNCRDQLLHAEQYPALFGGFSERLSLTKRVGKSSAARNYIAINLEALRNIADKTEKGKRQCALIRIYLRVRDTPRENLLERYQDESFHSVPETLPVPRPLKLSPTPQIPSRSEQQ